MLTRMSRHAGTATLCHMIIVAFLDAIESCVPTFLHCICIYVHSSLFDELKFSFLTYSTNNLCYIYCILCHVRYFLLCIVLVWRALWSVEAVWEAPAGPEGWTGERIQEAFFKIVNKQPINRGEDTGSFKERRKKPINWGEDKN